MSKRIAVIVIHGMGSQDIGFAEPMITEINNRISGLSKNPNDIAWKPIYWSDVLEERQIAYLRDAQRNHNIDFIGLRRFVITALGDATAYQKVMSDKNTTYEEIHERVGEKIKNLYENDLNNQACPLIILAHSLGGHIMSNYIWDMQKTQPSNLSSFEKFEHLSGMITFGCNIPLFTLAYEDIKPIKFPGSALSNDIKSKAKWLNFYDPDDILGYPLKAINDAYNAVVNEDIAINAGSIFTSWNPVAHSGYWTDNGLTKPVAKYISEFL